MKFQITPIRKYITHITKQLYIIYLYIKLSIFYIYIMYIYNIMNILLSILLICILIILIKDLMYKRENYSYIADVKTGAKAKLDRIKTRVDEYRTLITEINDIKTVIDQIKLPNSQYNLSYEDLLTSYTRTNPNYSVMPNAPLFTLDYVYPIDYSVKSYSTFVANINNAKTNIDNVPIASATDTGILYPYTMIFYRITSTNSADLTILLNTNFDMEAKYIELKEQLEIIKTNITTIKNNIFSESAAAIQSPEEPPEESPEETTEEPPEEPPEEQPAEPPEEQPEEQPEDTPTPAPTPTQTPSPTPAPAQTPTPTPTPSPTIPDSQDENSSLPIPIWAIIAISIGLLIAIIAVAINL